MVKKENRRHIPQTNFLFTALDTDMIQDVSIVHEFLSIDKHLNTCISYVQIKFGSRTERMKIIQIRILGINNQNEIFKAEEFFMPLSMSGTNYYCKFASRIVWKNVCFLSNCQLTSTPSFFYAFLLIFRVESSLRFLSHLKTEIFFQITSIFSIVFCFHYFSLFPSWSLFDDICRNIYYS